MVFTRSGKFVALVVSVLTVSCTQAQPTIEFMSRKDDGGLAPLGASFSTSPPPQISAVVEDLQIANDGSMTFRLVGTVTDEASSIVRSPGDRISRLDVEGPGLEPTGFPLASTALPEFPWRPYNFAAPFDVQVQMKAPAPGDYEVRLTTDPSAAGVPGETAVWVTVQPLSRLRTYQAWFSGPLLPMVPDQVVFFAGEERNGVTTQILTETGADTKIFVGDLYWGRVTVQVDGLDDFGSALAGLLADVEVETSDGAVDSMSLPFVQTAPGSMKFVASDSDTVVGPALGGVLNFERSPDGGLAWVSLDQDPGSGTETLIRAEGPGVRYVGATSWGWVEVTVYPSAVSGPFVRTHWSVTDREGAAETFGAVMNRPTTSLSPAWYDLGEKPRLEAYAVLEGGNEADAGPVIVRVDDPEGLLDSADSQIRALGADYPIEERDFGDGRRWYPIDGSGNVVVFLVSDLGTLLGQIADPGPFFTAEAVKGGQNVAADAKEKVKGLVVLGEASIADMLGKITEYEEIAVKVTAKDGTVTNGVRVVPKAGKDLGHTDDELETETLWRMVQTGTITLFRKKSHLQDDLKYRREVIKATDAFDSPFQAQKAMNAEFWQYDRTAENVLKKKGDWVVKTRVVDKADVTSAADATGDIFTNADRKTKYKMACLYSAMHSTNQAAAVVLGKAVFDGRVDRFPLGRFNDTHVDRAGDSETEWLPGEFGYFKNKDANAPSVTAGENVIYRGGCFDTDPVKFKKNAKFWGNIPGVRIKSMEEWLALVDSWSNGKGQEVRPRRAGLRAEPKP